MEIFSTKESLAVLGKLGALNAIGQRFPQEIYVLVESTLDEVLDEQITRIKALFWMLGSIGDIYLVSSGLNPANLGSAHTLLPAAGKGRVLC